MLILSIITTLLAFLFAGLLLKYARKDSFTNYMIWFAVGFISYAAGAIAECCYAVFGYYPFLVKLWYVSGALVGGWAIATGIIYHVANKKMADTFMMAGAAVLLILIAYAIFSPVNNTAEPGSYIRASVLQWRFIRPATGIVHLYSFLILICFSLYAAFQYSKSSKFKLRFLALLSISTGSFVPALGSSHGNMEITPSFYVTELSGLLFIYCGILLLQNDKAVFLFRQQNFDTGNNQNAIV